MNLHQKDTEIQSKPKIGDFVRYVMGGGRVITGTVADVDECGARSIKLSLDKFCKILIRGERTFWTKPLKIKGGEVEKHVSKEGSYQHVLYWDSKGRHCSEPDCEINKKKSH